MVPASFHRVKLDNLAVNLHSGSDTAQLYQSKVSVALFHHCKWHPVRQGKVLKVEFAKDYRFLARVTTVPVSEAAKAAFHIGGVRLIASCKDGRYIPGSQGANHFESSRSVTPMCKLEMTVTTGGICPAFGLAVVDGMDDAMVVPTGYIGTCCPAAWQYKPARVYFAVAGQGCTR